MTGYSNPKAKNLLFFKIIILVTIVVAILVAISIIIGKIAGRNMSTVLSIAAWVSNCAIRFVYEMLLSICLCLFLQISVAGPASDNEAQNWIVTAVLAICILGLIGLLVSLLFCGGPY